MRALITRLPLMLRALVLVPLLAVGLDQARVSFVCGPDVRSCLDAAGSGRFGARARCSSSRSTCSRSPRSSAASRNGAERPRCCGSSPPPASGPRAAARRCSPSVFGTRRPARRRLAAAARASAPPPAPCSRSRCAAVPAARGPASARLAPRLSAQRRRRSPPPLLRRRRRLRSSFASPASRGIGAPPAVARSSPRTCRSDTQANSEGAPRCRSPSASCANSAAPPPARGRAAEVPPPPRSAAGSAAPPASPSSSSSPDRGRPPPAAQAKPVAPAARQLVAGIQEHNGVLGDPKAPVTVTEYVDLQCPICAEASTADLPDPDRRLRQDRQGQAAGAHAALHRPGLGHRRQGRRRRRSSRASCGRSWRPSTPPGRRELRLRHRRLPEATSPRPRASTPSKAMEYADGAAAQAALDQADARRADGRAPTRRPTFTSSAATAAETVVAVGARRT